MLVWGDLTLQRNFELSVQMKHSSANGTSRVRYALAALGLLAVYAVAKASFEGAFPVGHNQSIGMFSLGFFWLGVLIFIRLTWKRLADAGLPTFFTWLLLVPFIGVVPLLLGLIMPSKLHKKGERDD
jgi:uncharacterized membrane protein YhaH (DUF805 family)